MSAASQTEAASAVLGRFVADLDFHAIPAEVIAHARLCLLDTLGCALYGSRLEWSRILRETLATVDTDKTSAIWGAGLCLGPAHAALVNGAAVHAFELDDLHRESILHAGSVVVPAALAAADIVGGVDGGRLLEALVAGYEVGARVGQSVGTAHLLAGWHPTGTHGTFAAAAAAAKIFGADARQAQQALGLAGSQSGGLMAAQFSAMVKRFHAGRASQSGLYSAMLAQNGYTGIDDVFEDPYGGYCATFAPVADHARLVAGLGTTWETAAVVFKRYSANGSCHPTIQILQRLRAEAHLRADEIEQITVHVSTATLKHVGWRYVPNTVTTAQMNLSYIAAVVLLDGEAFVDQFAADRIAEPATVALASRVRVLADPGYDVGTQFRHATRIEVERRDGSVVRAEQQATQTPSPEELPQLVRAKYHQLAGYALPPDRVRHVAKLVDSLGHDASGSAELVAALREEASI